MPHGGSRGLVFFSPTFSSFPFFLGAVPPPIGVFSGSFVVILSGLLCILSARSTQRARLFQPGIPSQASIRTWRSTTEWTPRSTGPHPRARKCQCQWCNRSELHYFFPHTPVLFQSTKLSTVVPARGGGSSVWRPRSEGDSPAQAPAIPFREGQGKQRCLPPFRPTVLRLLSYSITCSLC